MPPSANSAISRPISSVAIVSAPTFCSSTRARAWGVASKMSIAPRSSSPRVIRAPARIVQIPTKSASRAPYL